MNARSGGALVLAVACSAGSLEQASASYRRDRDCSSLRRIAAELGGVSRARVEAWLGPAEFEPTPGQHYYSSERADCSLVVDYRSAGALTQSVQQVELGAIGE
jgi:hypothetical protein